MAAASVRPDERRDVERRLAAARRLARVEVELESAMNRRTELWKQQSLNPDPSLSGELRTLSDRINALWAEARARRATIRGGSRERILRRVRAEARFEREATKTQGGAR